MRPLYYHYPHDARAIENSQTEFLIGDTLLSAPIFEEGATSRDVYMPEGAWFDYWDGTRYEGKTTYTIQAPLDRWPLLVRANSILPTGPVMQYVDQMPTDPLTITCYIEPNGQASYTLYEDDGNTFDYREGAFALTTFQCSIADGSITMRIDEQHTAYTPRRTVYEIIVHHGDRTLQQTVRAGERNIVVQL
jgi:alpha-glucosidase